MGKDHTADHQTTEAGVAENLRTSSIGMTDDAEPFARSASTVASQAVAATDFWTITPAREPKSWYPPHSNTPMLGTCDLLG